MRGNKNGSLTPEQLTMPGHEAHPQIGVAVGAGLGLVALGAVAPTVATAWGAGTVYDFVGDAISHGMGLSPDAPNFTKSFTVGGVTGAMAPLLPPLTTLGTGVAGKVAMGGYNVAVGGVGAFGATAITNSSSNPMMSGALGAGWDYWLRVSICFARTGGSIHAGSARASANRYRIAREEEMSESLLDRRRGLYRRFAFA